jgi:ATP:ADP antiporter, AAA family
MQRRPGETTTRGVLAATFASAAVIAHLVAAKAARDALFLARFEIAMLPRMMALGALVSLGTALVAAWLMGRGSPARLLFGALAASGVLYGVEWMLLERAPEAVAFALYVHVSALGATFVAALWSVVNERFDPYTAKREVGRIALGGSFGGVLGGIAGWLVSGARGVSYLLAMLLVLNLVTMAAVTVLARSGRSLHLSSKRVRPDPKSGTSGFKALRQSPYLATLAGFVALVSLSSALLDYVMSARVVLHYTDAARLAAFFALFHASLGVLAMLVQLVVTRATLERFGLAGTVALLPATVIALGVVGLGVPQLWSAVLLRGSEGLAQASFFRAGYELFYTPLPRAQKRPTKMLIDVGVDRLGTVAGAGLAVLVVSSFGGRAVMVLIGVAMAVSVGALYCASRLHKGYVEALAGRLRRGTLKLDEYTIFDGTTRRTLAETASLDRKQLLEAIERQHSAPPPGSEAPPSEHDEREDTVLVGPAAAGFEAAPGYVGFEFGSTQAFETARDDPLVQAIVDLRGSDPARTRAALAAPLAPELVAHVVPLLARDDVAREALRALQSVAERATGTLADALLDPARDVIVRRRLPRVFERTATPRAVRALIEGLFDAELEVRHQCALALLRLAELAESVTLPAERILEAVAFELDGERRGPVKSARADALDEAPGFGDISLRARAPRDVEHVMTLLALVIEREPVRLAYHALHADEPAIRGTALEYLENVLPERVKSGVLALLARSIEAPRQRPERRDAHALRAELERSRELVMPAALRNLRQGS